MTLSLTSKRKRRTMGKLELLLAALAAAGHIINRGISDDNGMSWTCIRLREGGETTTEITFFDNDFDEIIEIAKEAPSPLE